MLLSGVGSGDCHREKSRGLNLAVEAAHADSDEHEAVRTHRLGGDAADARRVVLRAGGPSEVGQLQGVEEVVDLDVEGCCEKCGARVAGAVRAVRVSTLRDTHDIARNASLHGQLVDREASSLANLANVGHQLIPFSGRYCSVRGWSNRSLIHILA